jgi:hypothetical protein
VAKRVLDVPCDGGELRSLDELSPDEPAQDVVGIAAGDAADHPDGAGPERFPEDCGILQHPLLIIGQRI